LPKQVQTSACAAKRDGDQNQGLHPVGLEEANIERCTRKHEGDNEKDTCIAGNSNGDHIALAVDLPDKDTANQHRQEYGNFHLNRSTHSGNDNAEYQQMLVFRLPAQDHGRQENDGGTDYSQGEGTKYRENVDRQRRTHRHQAMASPAQLLKNATLPVTATMV
jgi:hypothetical protein